MSTKTQMYSELAEKASKELTHSVNEWCMFLKSQAKLYKYPYAGCTLPAHGRACFGHGCLADSQRDAL